MSADDTFSSAIYEEQAHLAELEQSAFVSAVTASRGPQQAGLSE